MSSGKKKIYKILILGDSGVGKTSLMNQYVKQKFTQQYRATVGADFMSKDVQIDDKQVSLQIWDTAGQDRFQTLGAAFYRGTDCCVLVYDITDKKSFEDLEDWRKEFINQGNPNDPESFPFIIVGNKVDKQDQRKVTEKEAKDWCTSVGKTSMQHFECSAKDATNVEQAFQVIARAAASTEKEDIFVPETIKLKTTEPAKKNKQQGGCC